jgi:thymidylate synthase
MRLIVICSFSGGIASTKTGEIPYNKHDMKMFREKTKRSIVIMGRKTWQSLLTKPLPGRVNVVISNTLELRENALVYGSIDEYLMDAKRIKKNNNITEEYVIGGCQLYNSFMERDLISSIEMTVDFNAYKKFDLLLDFSISSLQTNDKWILKNTHRFPINTGNYVHYTFEYSNEEENAFLNRIKDVSQGEERIDRTGIGTWSIFSPDCLRFDLRNGKIPLLSLKPIPVRQVFEELMWFIRGQTDVSVLRDKNVHVWDGNTNRKFLDKAGLERYPEWDIGACFTSDAFVLTNSGYQAIKDVQKDDMVLTHNGEWKPVTCVHKYVYRDTLYLITVDCSCIPIRCTPNHPFLVKDSRKMNAPLSWVKAENLKPYHLAAIKLDDSSINSVNIAGKMFKISYNVAYILGLYIRCIHTNKYYVSNDGLVMIIEENKNSNTRFTTADIINTITMMEGIKVVKTDLTSIDRQTIETRIIIHKWTAIYDLIMGLYLKDGLYVSKTPDHVINLACLLGDVEKKFFLNGYFGSLENKNIEKTKFMDYPSALSIQRVLVNYRLTYSIQRCGENFSLVFQDMIQEESYTLSRLKSIEKENNENCMVYNLTVLDDKTFTVNNVVVHNSYSFQFRHSGAEYIDCKTDYTGQGIDQVKYVVDLLKNNPYSRRILINLWNPSDLDKMSLAPCGYGYQFYVTNGGGLVTKLIQRSSDISLAGGWNIASAALFTYMLAHVSGLKPEGLIWCTGDVHIYKNQIEAVQEMLKRSCNRPFPKLALVSPPNNIRDFEYENIRVLNYNPNKSIYMQMNA